MGSGATISLRAFLASKVDRSFSGRVFAVISATSTIGSLLGMPLMGTLYSLNISREAGDVSLPFATASVSLLEISGFQFLTLKQVAYFLVLCVTGVLLLSI